MNSPIVNRRDLDFLLYELLDTERLTERERYAEHSRETFDAAIETAHRVAVDYLQPHNRKADLNEPTFDGDKVSTIPEVKEALDVYCDTGLLAAGQDFERGGMQLPATVAQTCTAITKGANVGTFAYVGLTVAATNLILAHGSDEQIQRYTPYMLSGRFFGTMCLTEPQAGSSLGDLRTRAVPQDDGSYRIRGNKVFISGGDHELAENIVHMVLARTPDAPAGVRGISLFIVPKYLVNDDGSLGPRNDVKLAGLIHKMGYRGTTSTMLNFGENDECTGYLVGQPGDGLKCMFHMMNEARIGVGLGAVMLGYGGYLHSLAYARERRQGRAPGEKDPATPQRLLVEHADVRRMLLAQKSYVEGGLALGLYGARLVDDERTHPDAAARANATRQLALLTPVIKSWPSDYCLRANDLAIQILGGYGYTREYPVEQYFRDNRLNPIHEGTHGIQAQDLLGRKVRQEGGTAFDTMVATMRATVDEVNHDGPGSLAGEAEALARALEALEETTRALRAVGETGDTERYLANASDYLDMFGHIVIAWLWLRQAATAAAAQPASDDDRAFYQGKLAACRYFMNVELPKIHHLAALLRRGEDTPLNTDPDWL
ncbi:acyl-CoA dehydrogenase [Aquisalimonas lutea]|uniref:acyl-CoA dehydrogenase n=1 Tax=Aquisalimonas lutea TaxID=1327750 RepID=UPI0025B355E6|nr:acyl-CoA dehydrogenase [Aquisalimonas lutea]MDN3518793.1 acyl-CoA dehydrogenase [Aquisalimonas lutea]